MTRATLYLAFALAITFALLCQGCMPIVYCRDQPDGTHRCDVAVRIPKRLP